MKNKANTGHVQSLSRAFSILNIIANNPSGMALTAIAQGVELPLSTTHRLLTTLQYEQYVHFDNLSSLWKVGVQAFVVGNAFVESRDIISISRPYMSALMEMSGEVTNLAVIDQGDCIYLARLEPRRSKNATSKPMARLPIHSSAVGKALLSMMPEEKMKKILQVRKFERTTDKTLTNRSDLFKEIQDTRVIGFGRDDEEQRLGLRCVASSIFNEYGESIAAVSVSGPVSRIDDQRFVDLGLAIKGTAAKITIALGGVQPKNH